MTLYPDETERRIRILMPDVYVDRAEPVLPVSMGSAGLQFAADGTVAWDRMWASFCDLAMAGGPPHRGTLLLPGTAAEIAADPGRYRQVSAELCRGITLVTRLESAPTREPGWVRVECADSTMAGWLLRAITMENVAVRAAGSTLFLPAGPAFKIEKEMKNVITAAAKTTHYWVDHMPAARREAVADLFAEMELESPLQIPRDAADWRSVECATVPQAVATMRAWLAGNVLSRRENTAVFLPSASQTL